jgi:hypothetical protein
MVRGPRDARGDGVRDAFTFMAGQAELRRRRLRVGAVAGKHVLGRRALRRVPVEAEWSSSRDKARLHGGLR